MKFKQYKPMTVGELRDALADYPSDTPIRYVCGVGEESSSGTFVGMRMRAVSDEVKPWYTKVTRCHDISHILWFRILDYDSLYFCDEPLFDPDEEIPY